MTGREVLPLDGIGGADQELLGGKAAGINRMRALGVAVPPAFVLTTEVCRRYHTESRRVPEDVWALVPGFVRELESATGRTFGGGSRPLLLSVRSGAAVSMPGMMDTVLNLGMTNEVERALARESGALEHAAEIHRRFTSQFVKVTDLPVPADPWRQLRVAVGAVFESWGSRRAVTYRRDRGIPADGGTAVTVQAMVFGTLDDHSGTGVLFSRDPLTGAAEPYGEWLQRGQGEDLVSGRADARSLAELAARLPGVHRELLEVAGRLERDGRDVQDIEFTVESGQLWLLQTRTAQRSPEAAIRHAVAMAEEGLISRGEALDRISPEQVDAVLRARIDPAHVASAVVLARGKPASPGVRAGLVAADADEAEKLAVEGAGVVLARPTTDPDDVSAMSAADAVVTELGGSTSHAAVVCREMAVPCVVGCGVGTVRALAGRVVTVDGSTGTVYEGVLPVLAAGDLDDLDLAVLTRWARDEPGAAADANLPALLRDRG